VLSEHPAFPAPSFCIEGDRFQASDASAAPREGLVAFASQNAGGRPCSKVSLVIALHNSVDDFLVIGVGKESDRGGSQVSHGRQRQHELCDRLLVARFQLQDEIIGAKREPGILDLNAELAGLFARGRAAARHLLDGAHALIGVIAKQHIHGHDRVSLGLQGRLPVQGEHATNRRPRRADL
jgi:hypothetical protein